MATETYRIGHVLKKLLISATELRMTLKPRGRKQIQPLDNLVDKDYTSA